MAGTISAGPRASWRERLGERDAVRVYVAENASFRLPADGDTPLILIGAGTGVAPYRAFLQERAAPG